MKKSKERRFASWSGGGFGSKDFSVVVYSSDPHKDVEFFDIIFEEIFEFISKRYINYEFCETNDSPKSDYIYPNKFIFELDKGMIDWAVNRLKEPLGHIVAFDEIENLSELRALVRAGWCRYRQENSENTKLWN